MARRRCGLRSLTWMRAVSPERLALRRIVDAAKRARIAVANEGLSLCSGCGMPRDDWTPGCPTCRNRHYKRSRRYPGGEHRYDPLLSARVRICSEQLTIDHTREHLAFAAQRTRETVGARVSASVPT